MSDDLVKQLRERAAHFVGDDAVRLREAADRIEALETELAVCREAIEVCLDVADSLPQDDDGDAAVRRCTLRRLNEAVGKAVPRLMMERPEGQKLYGLAYHDMRKHIEADRAAMQQAVEACQLAEHALTFAPASYEELLLARHDAVDDLRAATEALRERLKESGPDATPGS